MSLSKRFAMMIPFPHLEMKGICKSIGTVKVNDQVDLTVEKGEIHALLGENGAGKTTLMKILYGLNQMDAGRIIYKNEEVKIRNVSDALNLGIGMVQHTIAQVPGHSVIENVVLGLGYRGFLRLEREAEQLKEIASHYKLDIDPLKTVAELSVSDQLRLELLKMLYRDVELIILDEPTSMIPPQELNSFFSTLKILKQEGKTIIFISHKLQEIMTVCDRCTVMHQGHVIRSGLNISEIDHYDELTQLIVGQDWLPDSSLLPVRLGPVRLTVQNLHYKDAQGQEKLKDINFELHSGEIMGICGVDGNGQTELGRCINGILKPSSGKILVNDIDCTGAQSDQSYAVGLGTIPRNRVQDALVPQMNVRENFALSYFSLPEFKRGIFFRWYKIDAETSRQIEEYDISLISKNQPILSLSAGDQQKVVIARELRRKPGILLASHPTRGLEPAATREIQQHLLEERKNGTAILYFSSDLDELMSMSDRMLVLFDGKVMGVIPRARFDRREISLLMTGIRTQTVYRPQEMH